MGLTVYCVDTLDLDGHYMKKWAELASCVRVGNWREIRTFLKSAGEQPDEALIVVHTSAISKTRLSELCQIPIKRGKRPYIMRVNAWGLDGSTSDDGLQHDSKIPFPVGLSHLNKAFEHLVTTLSNVPADAEPEAVVLHRKAAWDEWEGHARGLPHLAALAILCQGYLAVYADCTGEPEGVPDEDLDDVRVALKRMQWPDLCRGGNGRELLAEALLDDSTEGPKRRSELRSQVLCAGYWHPVANALREQNRSRDKAIEWVELSEWDALTGQASWGDVKELFSAIWDFPTSILSPGNVAKAFVQLANRLGTV